MEISLDTLISILSLFIGGGGGAFFTWRYVRQKAKAEADAAETSAAKESQDMYQQLIADLKTDREYQREQMEEMRKDRDQYKKERDEMRKQFDKYDEDIRTLKNDVARNGRMVESMRPFLCGRSGCKDRISVVISASGEISPRKKVSRQADIEPVDAQDI